MKCILKSTAVFAFFTSVMLYAVDFGVSDMLIEPLTYDRLRFMPVTSDFRNYFVLQAIDNHTNVLIGDFVGAEKKIILAMDEGADNSLDQVIEYYPDSKKKKNPGKPNSDLFSNMKKMKQDIIGGVVFEENYSYKMRSLPSLLEKLEEGSDIFKYKHGYTVKLYDPDKPNTIMSEFFFGRKGGKYDLQFKTLYYKLYHTTIKPPIYYSVYCENSSDPIVKETVEKLIKIVE